MLTDTSPEAKAVQIRLLRELGPSRRMRMAFEITDLAFAVSRSGLRQRFPDASPKEIELRLFEINHGRRLADALRAELARRESEERLKEQAE